jgi:ATP-binding cassette subfamily B protein/subfamily B ATP-binding cassette protein MsbA
MIDGQNISKIEQKNLFENVSIVFSNPYLFKGSIYENIIVDNLKAEKNEVEEICKLVELYTFIKNNKKVTIMMSVSQGNIYQVVKSKK